MCAVPRAALLLCVTLAACTALPPADFTLAGAEPVPKAQLEFRACRPPSYPAQAIANAEAGAVEVLTLISPRGDVIGARIVQGSGYQPLDQAVLESMGTCFFPALDKSAPQTNRYAVLRETFLGPKALRFRP